MEVCRIMFSAFLTILGFNIAFGESDFSKVTPVEFHENVLKLHATVNHKYGEKRDGCMCPKTLNTKGGYWKLCGDEIKSSTNAKCAEEGLYRCVDNHPEAILEADCKFIPVGPKKCAKRPGCKKNCEYSKDCR